MVRRSVGQRVFYVGIVDKTGKLKMRQKWEFELNDPTDETAIRGIPHKA